MGVKTLTPKTRLRSGIKKMSQATLVSYRDDELQTGGITIDQDAYTAGLDRTYDVRGLKNMHIEIENTGGANGLTYKIEKARKDFADVSTLVDADFDQDIKADTNVAFGTTVLDDIADISPETTSIRIRIKRQTASQDTTLAGIVSAN